MKMLKVHDTQIELREKGLAGVIIGAVLAFAGIGAAVAPFFVDAAPQWLLFAGIGGVAMGALLMFTAADRTVTVIKGGALTITKKRVLGGAPKVQTYDATKIVKILLDISVRQNYSRGASGRNQRDEPRRERTTELRVVFGDASEVLVARKSTSTGTAVQAVGALIKAPLSEEGAAIATLLGVELVTNNATPGLTLSPAGIANAVSGIASMVGAQQTTAAVATPVEPQQSPQPPVEPIAQVAQPQPAQPVMPVQPAQPAPQPQVQQQPVQQQPASQPQPQQPPQPPQAPQQ